jgi:hypothetical protein
VQILGEAMNWQVFLINRVAAMLLGADIWGQAQAVVHILENEQISGAEKRAQAFEMLKKVAKNMAIFLINLGIELAVAKLRSTANNVQ